MANIIDTEEICGTCDIGEVIWLECYFDGHTCITPFMYDLDYVEQQPVITNANDCFYNSFSNVLEKNIMELFHERWKNKQFRWWDSKPTDEERNNIPWHSEIEQEEL